MKTTIEEMKMLKNLKSMLSEVECDIIFNPNTAIFSINVGLGYFITDIIGFCENWISGKSRELENDLIEEYEINYYEEGVFYG